MIPNINQGPTLQEARVGFLLLAAVPRPDRGRVRRGGCLKLQGGESSVPVKLTFLSRAQGSAHGSSSTSLPLQRLMQLGGRAPGLFSDGPSFTSCQFHDLGRAQGKKLGLRSPLNFLLLLELRDADRKKLLIIVSKRHILFPLTSGEPVLLESLPPAMPASPCTTQSVSSLGSAAGNPDDSC